ncbi:MAG: xanthine dehydrogenase family protein molybdopterin-binding subunit [Chthoniobacterales bacterium]
MNVGFQGLNRDRFDAKLKVTGRAKYAGDHDVANMAFGYLIQSSISRGQIRSFDLGAAQESSGVIAIFTPFNSLKLYHPLGRDEGVSSGDVIPLLQDTQVHYFGQTIGLVVADSFEQARDAAALVKVIYEPKAAVVTLELGMANAYEPQSVDQGPATWSILESGASSIDDILRQAEVSIAQEYTNPIEHHNPMEPHATVAVWEEDRLTMYDATQGVGGQQRNLAAVLGIDDDHVRVICPFVGGAFGCKGSMWMHSPLTAAAARVLNRPVKTILTREQMYTATGHRPALSQKIDLGATRDGVLRAVKHEVFSSTAVTKEFIEAAAHRTSRYLYKSPNILVSHRLVPLDIAPGTFMRAPGEAPGMYALESAMDELAVKLGIDPIELRIKNHAEIYPGKNVPFSSKHLLECYQRGAEKFGWAKRNPKPGMTKDDDWWIGQGMATALYPAHRSAATAKIRLQADGYVTVSSGTLDLGTGMYTVLAIVGAQSLDVPYERVRAVLGDSALPPAPGAGGSQSTASVGPAVLAAAELAKKKLIEVALKDQKSPFHGAKPEELSYTSGEIRGNGQSLPFDQLLGVLGRSAIEATGSSVPGDEQHKYGFSSFGAQFCEVKVHALTGEVRVNRFSSVMDIGTVVSEKTARNQIMGGIVFGIGMALLEGTQYDVRTGWIANRNIAEYLVPTNADVPAIEVEFLNRPDLQFNSIGARGMGEIGITGTPAAIANAVYHATGKRVRQLPIRPEHLLA